MISREITTYKDFIDFISCIKNGQMFVLKDVLIMPVKYTNREDTFSLFYGDGDYNAISLEQISEFTLLGIIDLTEKRFMSYLTINDVISQEATDYAVKLLQNCEAKNHVLQELTVDQQEMIESITNYNIVDVLTGKDLRDINIHTLPIKVKDFYQYFETGYNHLINRIKTTNYQITFYYTLEELVIQRQQILYNIQQLPKDSCVFKASKICSLLEKMENKYIKLYFNKTSVKYKLKDFITDIKCNCAITVNKMNKQDIAKIQKNQIELNEDGFISIDLITKIMCDDIVVYQTE